MKKILLTIASVTATAVLFAQSRIEADLAGFNAVKVTGNITLTLVQGDSCTLKTTVNNNFVNQLSWTVKDSVLVLQLRNDVFPAKGKEKPMAAVTVTAPSVTSIDAGTNSTVRDSAVLSADLIRIRATDKANVVLELKARDVSVHTGSGASVIVKGDAEYVTIDARTGSSVNSVQANPKVLTAVSGGGAECYVRAEKKLQLRAVSKGAIYYKNEAEIVNQETKLFGKIEVF